MSAYVIMAPAQGRQGQRGPREEKSAADVLFIRDGFAVLAFVAPVIWLAWHRLWIEAALALAAAVLIAGLANGNPGLSLLSFVVALYVGLEGPALRIAALRRRGWRDVAVVDANSSGEAEIRYFAAVATDYQEPSPDLFSFSGVR